MIAVEPLGGVVGPAQGDEPAYPVRVPGRQQYRMERSERSAARHRRFGEAGQDLVHDIGLVLQVAPDPVFRREGKDVHVIVPVPLHVALGGGEVSAPTLKGGQVQFKVPPETQNGTKIRLRGLGMPDAKGGPPGDMYAEVKVQLPVPMDERTRKWASEQPLS